ncbi:MAG TPA: DUF5818 domain-containing protein [Thermoanaerobaculia bacterium]|nr:DUF5818 domain-containing protein [Thermoanaerobaculia bacterium]
MRKRLLVALTFVVLAACSAATDTTATDSATTDSATTDTTTNGRITVTGTISDEGVECLALRGDDGKLYTLGRPRNPPASGQRVRVTGTIAETSICMQGTTINVETIEVSGAS